MNQHSVTLGKPATRAPVFFWITVALLAMLLLGGAAAALFLVFAARNINPSGGWGWLLVAGIYVVATTVICSACALVENPQILELKSKIWEAIRTKNAGAFVDCHHPRT